MIVCECACVCKANRGDGQSPAQSPDSSPGICTWSSHDGDTALDSLAPWKKRSGRLFVPTHTFPHPGLHLDSFETVVVMMYLESRIGLTHGGRRGRRRRSSLLLLVTTLASLSKSQSSPVDTDLTTCQRRPDRDEWAKAPVEDLVISCGCISHTKSRHAVVPSLPLSEAQPPMAAASSRFDAKTLSWPPFEELHRSRHYLVPSAIQISCRHWVTSLWLWLELNDHR